MTDKTYKKHIHFIGIKGVAMTALAIAAKERGYKVTGSDIEEDFPTKEILAKFKITPLLGFKKENLGSLGNLGSLPDLVIMTGAHGGMNNPEAAAAQKMGLKVLMHGQALAEFARGKKTIAVAGSHGKTTVAAMIAHLLVKADLDPSYAVGCGDIRSLGASGHAGKGEYFVVEADEYATDPGYDPTPRFFHLEPYAAIITNIEYDHPDVYGNIQQLKSAFLTFANKTFAKGLLVAGIDNENMQAILPSVKIPRLTFGFSPLADYQISKPTYGAERTWFHLKYKNVDLGQFTLKVPGRLNSLNAAGAAITANWLGMPWEEIRRHLLTFQGTKRRFEKIGERDGIIFFDDYAHHPTQIKSTLEAARSWFPGRKIICIFQPHTFSRTKALFYQFAQCFTQANEVIITDIYPSAREKADPTVNSHLLVNEAQKYHQNVSYLPTIKEAADFLKKEMTVGDIIMTMGAGNIYKIYEKYFESI